MSKVVDAKLAVALIRVSTDDERQGLSIAGQRAAIAAWASKEGVTIVEEVVEEASGGASFADRPELLRALALVGDHGAGLLVCHRVDRFSRDPMSACLAEAELVRAGATVAFVDGAGGGDDPTSKMVRGILLAVGQFERAMIAARIKSALAVKASRGELTGSAPYGMRAVDSGEMRVRRGNDGKATPVRVLVEDEGEQAVLARARALRASGASLRAIIVELGPVSRKGTMLSVAAVHAMLAA